MTETTITDVKTGGRSGYGAVPMTVSILNFDPTLGCDPLTFQPCSDRALSNLKVVGDKFTEIYPINKKLSDQFPYVGFFLEDQLYNGQVRGFYPPSPSSCISLTYGPRFNTSRPSMSQNKSLMHFLHGT